MYTDFYIDIEDLEVDPYAYMHICVHFPYVCINIPYGFIHTCILYTTSKDFILYTTITQQYSITKQICPLNMAHTGSHKLLCYEVKVSEMIRPVTRDRTLWYWHIFSNVYDNVFGEYSPFQFPHL